MPDQQSHIAGDLSPPIGGEVNDATSPPSADGGPGALAGAGWFSPLRIGIALVLVAAALIVWQETRSSAPVYRTGTVESGTVEATLDSVGTITPTNQASLNFNVTGTVSAVDVSVGQTVTAGQTLASLNIADLNATVVSAQATLAAAQATLASAEASQTDAEEVSSTSSGTTTSTSSVPTTSTTTTTVPSSGSGSSASGKITQLQATLVSDQMQLDADSSQAGSTLAQATTVCAAPVSPGTPSAPTTTSTTTTTDPSPDGGGAPPTCSEALSQASAAQGKVATDIKTVSQDESALTSALEASAGSGSSTGSPSGTGKTGATSDGTAPTSSGDASTSSGGASTSSGGTASAGSSTAGSTAGSAAKTSKVATPQQLAVDQASIDTAEANLSDAQQALSGVNLVSTISGTVASVSIEDGDSVTAGSSSSPAQIVVIGTGTSYDVATDVSVADIGEVAIGQQVQVTPDATNTVVNGQVSSIGVLATSGSTSTTYPVTISLESPDLGQLSGADANLSIIVKKSVDVTTVPSSAVRTVGSIHLVTVVHDNTAKSVRVTLGTVGDVLTQVTSGVSSGQNVALANLNEPLPSTSTATTRSGFGGGGLGGAGFGGGGLGGAGFGGGGFGGGGGLGGRFGG